MTKKDFLDKYRRDDIAPSTGKCIFKVFKEQMMELEKRNLKKSQCFMNLDIIKIPNVAAFLLNWSIISFCTLNKRKRIDFIAGHRWHRFAWKAEYIKAKQSGIMFNLILKRSASHLQESP